MESFCIIYTMNVVYFFKAIYQKLQGDNFIKLWLIMPMKNYQIENNECKMELY